MKKAFLLFLCSIAVLALPAQRKKPQKTLPVPVDTAAAPIVETEDPMNKASWQRSGKNAKSEFTDTSLKKQRTVTYDATGNMVISDDGGNELNSDAYPPIIADYYTQKYPGEKFKVSWTKDKIGNKVYYINRKPETFWFNQEGKYTHSTKTNNNSKK